MAPSTPNPEKGPKPGSRAGRNGKSSGKGKKLMDDKSSLMSVLESITKATTSPTRKQKPLPSSSTPSALSESNAKPLPTKAALRKKANDRALHDAKRGIQQKTQIRKRARKDEAAARVAGTTGADPKPLTLKPKKKIVGFAV